MQIRNSERDVSKMLLAVGVVLLALTTGIASAQEEQDECEPPHNVDYLQMAIAGVYQTSECDGMTEEAVEDELKDARKDLSRKYKEFLDERDEFEEDLDDGKTSIEWGELPPSDGDDIEGSIAHFAYDYFRPVCPWSNYILRKYQWYFSYTGDDYRKCCWPFYDIYVSHCWNRYCNWNHEYTTVWAHFNRCFPYYRTYWVLSRCLTTYDDGTQVWSTEFVRRTLPRGCSCHRIAHPFAIDKTCPAAG